MFDQHRAPARQFGDETFRLACLGKKFSDAEVQYPALDAKFEDFEAGHARRDVRTRKAVNLEVTVVEEDDPLPRVGDDDALLEVVQGGADEGISSLPRPLDAAQRRYYPHHDRKQKAENDDTAQHHLPDQLT